MTDEVKVTHNIPSLNKRITALENQSQDDQSERIKNLECCIAKMAHYNGGANERILREHGINPYLLQQKDMSRAL